jgi:hypothetical protein
LKKVKNRFITKTAIINPTTKRYLFNFRIEGINKINNIVIIIKISTMGREASISSSILICSLIIFLNQINNI